ncbi:hypothetical protein H9I38_10640, partial [Arthrobacter sp. UM1]|nr:hypothetical protein [Arthrobacter sp. UM1]
ETHTHRVIAAGKDGVRTKGDINGAADPGALDQSRLVGKAFFVSPVLGWLVKMTPIAILGLLLGLFFTRRVESPVKRFQYRVMAFFLGLAASIVIVKPLVGAELLWMRVDSSGRTPHATASVVSTGLFPMRVVPFEDKGAASQVLSPTGTVGEAVSTHLDKTGHFVLLPQLALTTWWWIGLAVFCLTPIVWLGIHARMHRNDPEPDQPSDEAPEPEGAA